eukprot:37800-Eustigmatos_ZCMA.PRE.1
MGRMLPSGQSRAGTLAMRKSHSPQSLVCVVITEPSAVACKRCAIGRWYHNFQARGVWGV